MESEDFLYQAYLARIDEIRKEYGYNEELPDDIDALLWSLKSPVKEKVEDTITLIIRSYYEDFVNVYRGAFRDGLQYGIHTMREGGETCTSLKNLLRLLEKN